MKNSISFFGVSFVNHAPKVLKEKIVQALDEKTSLRIATVNPEFLLEARKNFAFKESLDTADLRVVDGFGIQLLAWLQGVTLCRYPGANLLHFLLAKAEDKSIPVYIATKESGLSSFEEIQVSLQKKFPKLTIQPFLKGSNSFHILLCNYGAPEQEYFLQDNSQGRVSMGVGGALDFYTGKQKRAPKIFQALGLEWLWRLLWQPKRVTRIIRAVIIFPLLVLWERIFKAF